ncbi:MAG: hemerythrin domain-containing protein [Anaerolineae bacterium]
MSQAINDLTNEHQAILAALQTLEKMRAVFLNTHKIDAADMTDFIGFLREFADKCHHGKEELLLFPALVAAGVQAEGGPITALTADHNLSRKLVVEMGAAAQDQDEVRMANASQEYIRLLRLHIPKEEDTVFSLAERILSQQRLAELFEGFEAHEEHVIGHGRHEELHAVLERLHAKYVRD